jgi:hypothetical protein
LNAFPFLLEKQWQKDFQNIIVELTAAGLLRTYTLFPFNSTTKPKLGQKYKKKKYELQKIKNIFKLSRFEGLEAIFFRDTMENNEGFGKL